MARQNIAYSSDIRNVATVPNGAAGGNVATFGDGNALVDSGKRISDFATSAELEYLAAKVDTAIGPLNAALEAVA